MLFNRRPREVTVEEIALEFVLLEHARVDDDDEDETTLTKDVVVEDTNDDCDTTSVPVPAPDGAADDDCDWTVMVLQKKSISAYPQNIVSLSRNQIFSDFRDFVVPSINFFLF